MTQYTTAQRSNDTAILIASGTAVVNDWFDISTLERLNIKTGDAMQLLVLLVVFLVFALLCRMDARLEFGNTKTAPKQSAFTSLMLTQSTKSRKRFRLGLVRHTPASQISSQEIQLAKWWEA